MVRSKGSEGEGTAKRDPSLFFGGKNVGSTFKWTATFLNEPMSPVLVHGAEPYQVGAELASKIAWAIGTTMGVPYKKHSTLRDDCKFLANFIVEAMTE